MVYVWGLVIGLLLVASGAYAIRRPDGFGPLDDRFDPGEPPERLADFERGGRLAGMRGLSLVVASALLQSRNRPIDALGRSIERLVRPHGGDRPVSGFRDPPGEAHPEEG